MSARPASESARPGWVPWVATSAVIAAGLAFVAWAKMETVQLTYEIDDLIDREDELAEEQRRLRAELATLRSHGHLAELAEELGLEEPDEGQVVFVTADPGSFAAAVDEDAAPPPDPADEEDAP